MLKSVRRLGGTPIIAALVCVLALGGTATAAKLITGKSVKNGSLTGKDIKNRSVKAKDISKGAKSALRGPKGAKGDAGPAGPKGATGATGAKGDQGTAGLTGAPSGWMTRLNNLSTGALVTEYGYVNTPSTAVTSAADRALLTPFVALRATRMTVLLNDNPSSLASRTFVLRVAGEDTDMECSIIGSAISCTSDDPVTIPPSAGVVISTTTSTGQLPDAADAQIAITLERG